MIASDKSLITFNILFTTKKRQQRLDVFINYIKSFYHFVLHCFITSFYYFVIEFSKITNFHFKASDLRSIVEKFKSTDTDLRNITIVNFCFNDTSEKTFVEDFKLNVVDAIIDEKFEDIKNETTTIDVSTIIVNGLNIVVDSFERRFGFLS